MEFSSAERSRLVICSSHADAAYLEQLRASLRKCVPAEALDEWDEARLVADSERVAFGQALKAARLLLLLISPETLSPDYLPSGAVLALLESAIQDGAQLFCVLTRPFMPEQSAPPNDLRPFVSVRWRASGAWGQFPTINPASLPVSAMSQAERQQLWEKLADQACSLLGPDAADRTVGRKDLPFDPDPEGPERVSAGIDWDRELEAAFRAVHGGEPPKDEPEHSPALLAAPAAEPLHFLACAPGRVAAASWNTLLVYAHSASAVNSVYRDAARFTQDMPDCRYLSPDMAARLLARGAELTIVPQGPGLTFNPARLSLNWLEDWQQVPFRFSATAVLAGSTAEAEITIYAGALMLATIKVPFFCAEKATGGPESAPLRDTAADAAQQRMTCFRCGTENPPGRRFCLICNYDLAPRNVPNLQAPHETWLPFIYARLTVVDGPNKEQHFNLHEHTVTTIGRAPGNDIMLSDPAVSRYHARLRFEVGRWIIEDTSSTLGTYVNGRRIRWPQPIADGDQLRLAHTHLLFRIVQ